MTADAGWRYPKPLGALVGISGYIFEPERLLREMPAEARTVPALFTHGTSDPLIPIDASRSQVAQLKAAGLNVGWKEFRKAHTIEGPAELSAIRTFLIESLSL